MTKKRKHPPGYAGHVEPPHYCFPPRLWPWRRREWSLGDVWQCAECGTSWVVTVDEGGRYWQEFNAWKRENDRPMYESFTDKKDS